jgi:hypothetical protein
MQDKERAGARSKREEGGGVLKNISINSSLG